MLSINALNIFICSIDFRTASFSFFLDFLHLFFLKSIILPPVLSTYLPVFILSSHHFFYFFIDSQFCLWIYKEIKKMIWRNNENREVERTGGRMIDFEKNKWRKERKNEKEAVQKSMEQIKCSTHLSITCLKVSNEIKLKYSTNILNKIWRIWQFLWQNYGYIKNGKYFKETSCSNILINNASKYSTLRDFVSSR